MNISFICENVAGGIKNISWHRYIISEPFVKLSKLFQLLYIINCKVYLCFFRSVSFEKFLRLIFYGKFEVVQMRNFSVFIAYCSVIINGENARKLKISIDQYDQRSSVVFNCSKIDFWLNSKFTRSVHHARFHCSFPP